MTLKRIIFIRPGETEWNKIGRWQGTVAIPLNTHGIKQAQRLAKFIRNINLDVIYSSDLRRARDTAAVLSEYAHVTLHFDERLRERHMGTWQGLTTNEIRDWYKAQYQELIADPHHVVIPAGESRAQVAERVYDCFQEIMASDLETIGIISHTTAIRTLMAKLAPDSKPYDMLFRNMSVTTLANNEGAWEITQLDDVTHLEGMKSDPFRETIG
ncbi:MAG: histidine phosphatase family protein [Anaerolineae bacterium]